MGRKKPICLSYSETLLKESQKRPVKTIRLLDGFLKKPGIPGFFRAALSETF